MKLKTIIAAVMTLALTAGALEVSDINPSITALADTAKKTYTKDIFLDDPGAIHTGGVQADEGDEVSFTLVTNEEGYVIGRFVLKFGSITLDDSTTLIDDSPYVKEKTYTFIMPAGNVTWWNAYLAKDPDYVDPDPTPDVPITPTEPTTPTAPTEPTTPTTPTEPTTPTTPTEPETPTVPAVPQYKKGDVNGDGIVSAKDATLILKHSVGLITLDTEQLDRADVNGDGRVNAADATLILKMSVGLA